MTRVFYLHWNEKELKERVKPLKDLGLKIHAHWSTEETAKWGEGIPDIFIISLDRLPSHGRQYAQWLWEAKSRQHIPLLFVDGATGKVEQTRRCFPSAIFCTSEHLVSVLKSILNTEGAARTK